MLDLNLSEYVKSYEHNKTCFIAETQGKVNLDEISKASMISPKYVAYNNIGCSSFVQYIASGRTFIVALDKIEIKYTNLTKDNLQGYLKLINDLCYNVEVNLKETNNNYYFAIYIKTKGQGLHAYTAYCLIRYLKYDYFYMTLDFIINYLDSDLTSYQIFILAHYYQHFYCGFVKNKLVNPYFSAIASLQGRYCGFNLLLQSKLPSKPNTTTLCYENNKYGGSLSLEGHIRFPSVLKERLLEALIKKDLEFIKKLL
jgi:hypothetical protein